MDIDALKALGIAALIGLAQNVLAGIGSGVKVGVEKRVSNLITTPTKPRRKKRKNWFQKLISFLFLAAIIYAAIKLFPLLLVLL